MKKKIFFILSCAVVLALAGGCQGSSKQETKAKTETKASKETETKETSSTKETESSAQSGETSARVYEEDNLQCPYCGEWFSTLPDGGLWNPYDRHILEEQIQR